MDYTVIAVIGLIAMALIIGHRFHSRTWSGRPGYQYQRAISVGMFGLWLTIAGVIGWDVRHVRGFFQGTDWVGGLIWWQIGAGAALLALAVFLARRIPPDATRSPTR